MLYKGEMDRYKKDVALITHFMWPHVT